MVNIQSVVVIGPDTVESFNSYESFWAAKMTNIEDPERRVRQQHRAAAATVAESNMEQNYSLTSGQARNVTSIFGTIREARQRMTDEYTRNLVCNPEHRVVLQMWTLPGQLRTISTVYRAYDHEIITVITNTLRGPEVADADKTEQ